MKKILLILAAIIALSSFCACGTPTPEETAPTGETTAQSSAEATTFPSVTVEDPVASIEMSYILEDGTHFQISVYPWEEGRVWVEYSGDEKKAASMDEAILHNLALAAEESKLNSLNNRHIYEEGGKYFSMYVSFASDTIFAASYSGANIPEDFLTAYKNLENAIKELMSDVPLYVPQPMVYGTPNEAAHAEILTIVSATGTEYPDAYMVSDVPLDENFTGITGLESTNGISSATDLSPLMSSSPFQMVIVTLEDGADATSVKADFMDNIAWNKWVCVSADGALVAQKGNLVIFLMAGQNSFDTFAAAIEECGWTGIETTLRPMPR